MGRCACFVISEIYVNARCKEYPCSRWPFLNRSRHSGFQEVRSLKSRISYYNNGIAISISNCDNLIPWKATLSILTEWVIRIHYDHRTVIWYKMKFNAIYQMFNDNIQYVLIPKNLTYNVYISFILLIHLILSL